MKSIILIGMMGSGKTTIGQALAADLSKSWVDTDQYIEEKEQQSISYIFEHHGESYFRDCETHALSELLSHVDIISTGGGIIVTEANRHLIQNEATVIYLKAEIKTLIHRINQTNRPLLQDEDIQTKLETLYKKRHQWYESCAHLTIEIDELGILETVDYIKSALKLY